MGTTRLTMPVLVLTGEKASGQFLIDQARLVATDVKGVVIKAPGTGSWKKHPVRSCRSSSPSSTNHISDESH